MLALQHGDGSNTIAVSRLRNKKGKFLCPGTKAPMLSIVLLCAALLLAKIEQVDSQLQLPCNVHRDSITKTIPSTTSNFTISCSVDAQNALDMDNQVLWRWVKLSPDVAPTIESYLGGGSVSGRNFSMIELPGGCATEGRYQALYFDVNSNQSCLSSCHIVVEVIEVRLAELMTEFNKFSVVPPTMIPSSSADSSTITGQEGTVQSVGRCSSNYVLPSRCEVEVTSAWYYNGDQFDPFDRQDSYTDFATGELQIKSLNQSTAGYYVCVTMPLLLNRTYQTYSTNVVVAIPTTGQPPMISSQASTVLSTELGGRSNLVGVLKGWEIGLIVGLVSLAIVILLIAGAIGMGYLTVKNRNKPKTAPQMLVEDHARPRLKSMQEEIQMGSTYAETDMVDYGGPVEIAFRAILFEELLHKGTFKVVHHGTVNQPESGMLSVPVAVKRLKDENSELGYEELLAEVSYMKSFQEKGGAHPNIASLVGMTTQGGPTCLLLEYVPHGTLEDFLTSLFEGPSPDWYIKFTKDTLRGAYHKHVSGDLMNIIVQVADGMNYLTEQGLIHRDLATRNVLIGERLNLKIANPGMLHEGYYYMVTERGHFLQDMAPECQWEKRYSIWSDIWSFGILVHRVVTLNNLPFPDIEPHELYGKIEGGERPRHLTCFSNELYFLLQRCWQFIATERPSFPTIMEDLAHMADKPTRHIILKATKDCTKPGYINDSGQVFLLAIPTQALQEDLPQKKAGRRSSGTIRSLISSIDDTVYTRETVETVLDFTQSENENDNYNNYEEYLKGEDLKANPVAAEPPQPGKSEKRRSYETDTSGNDLGTSDTGAVGRDSETSLTKKKKRRKVNSGNKDRKKRKEVPAFTNVMFQEQMGRDRKEISTDDAPSMTEEEDKEGNTSNPVSGSESNRDSKENLVEL